MTYEEAEKKAVEIIGMGCKKTAVIEALTAAYGAGYREGVASIGDPVSEEASAGRYDKPVQDEEREENLQ